MDALPVTLEIGDLLFQGGDGPSEGLYLNGESLKGWRDRAASKTQIEERPQDHGAFGVTKALLGSKVVSVEGHFIGESITNAYRMMSRLSAMPGDGTPFTMTVRDPEGTFTAEGIVVNGPTLPGGLWQAYFDFAFDVVIFDPRRYELGQADSTGLPTPGTGMTWPVRWPVNWGRVGDLGRITIHNTGTAESWPLFKVSGGLPDGFTIAEVGSGREIRFEGVVPEGDVLWVDPRTGLALLDNEFDRSGDLRAADWWSVPPNGSSTIQFTSLGGSTGTPMLETTFASAMW